MTRVPRDRLRPSSLPPACVCSCCSRGANKYAPNKITQALTRPLEEVFFLTKPPAPIFMSRIMVVTRRMHSIAHTRMYEGHACNSYPGTGRLTPISPVSGGCTAVTQYWLPKQFVSLRDFPQKDLLYQKDTLPSPYLLCLSII